MKIIRILNTLNFYLKTTREYRRTLPEKSTVPYPPERKAEIGILGSCSKLFHQIDTLQK